MIRKFRRRARPPAFKSLSSAADPSATTGLRIAGDKTPCVHVLPSSNLCPTLFLLRTCRFGTGPATSVLDVNCKAHELDNLYVVDTSFFPSIGAVNPALTAMANALRVGEHLRERLA